MERQYVEQRDGSYFVAGTRVSLDSIVYAFLRGESPEGIVESFPFLTLEQVFGALTFYLANRNEIDQYLKLAAADFDRMRIESQRQHPALYAKLEAARQASSSSRK
jgi:uncharacterized protein (DUF433 family)